ncbi:lipopolysaccharide transport periplasmic protein LptA [Methyloligella halotolerans]|uniref:Lipopolysaccharide transport periplasmic protein LptA n=1 Tax=Methyloligella halotolerans TaxID=1177755 RepID=A0A1E2S005_9HYPH|nr:LptA/OstA family protein [Methyloligella halotolerans]ODA67801.1 lipopolysaccharide transport periplasmic protein LptA [Methyloligella halotolerans]
MTAKRSLNAAPPLRRAIAVVGALAAFMTIFTAASAFPAFAQTIKGGAVGAKPGAFKGLSKNSNEPIDITSERLTVYDAKKVAVFTGKVRAVQGDTTLRTTELHVFYKGSANPLGTAPDADRVADAEGQTAPSPEGGEGGGDAAQNPASQLTKIEAKGNVVIVNGENQSSRGDHLLYDVETQLVTMTGNVLITSDKDQTTKGDTAVYDMTKETVTVRGDVLLSKGKEQSAHSDWAIYDVPGELVTVGGNVVLTQGQNVLKGNKLVVDLASGQSRFENTGDASANNRIRALFMPNEGGKGKSSKGDSGEDEDGGPMQLIPRSN